MGCFASILSRSLQEATRYRQDQIDASITHSYVVYRGLSLTPPELKMFMVGQKINLAGYVSTSRQKDQSLIFAFKNQDPTAYQFNLHKKSVLFHVDLTDGTISGYCFLMNQKCFTRYPEEEEILLDDGRPFIIDNIVYDQPFPDEPFKNMLITHVYLTSSLPRGMNHKELGQLSTECTFEQFVNNKYSCIKNQIPKWLCFFQTETKDKAIFKATENAVDPTSFSD